MNWLGLLALAWWANWFGGNWRSGSGGGLLGIMLGAKLLKLYQARAITLWVVLVLALLWSWWSNRLKVSWLLTENWWKLLARAWGTKWSIAVLHSQPLNLFLAKKVWRHVHAAWALSWAWGIEEPGRSGWNLLWHDWADWGGDAAKGWLALERVSA